MGKLSPYINVDSEDLVVRKQSEEALNQELAYASHLGLPAIMFSLRGDNQINLARMVHNKMQAGSTYQVSRSYVKLVNRFCSIFIDMSIINLLHSFIFLAVSSTFSALNVGHSQSYESF